MGSMKPNFGDELNLKGGGERVAAWGPCNWDTDSDARRVRIDNVRIEQGDIKAFSSGEDVREKDDPDWNLEAQTDSGERLARGDAHAYGTATVIDPPGGEPWPWHQPVRLN